MLATQLALRSLQLQGLQSRRINLHSGFDLYQPATWERLKQLRAQRKPKKIWLSLPCTKFCQWTYINYASPEGQELLKQYQRRERKMLWCMNSFVRDALLQDPDCQIYYEWVFPCRGWQEAPMLDLEKYINSIGLPWLDCRVDGCRYGLMDSKNEGFIRKRWLIKTTDEQFTSTTRPRPVWGLTTMFGSKGLKRLDRHIILGVFVSQWLVFGNSSFCLTSI